MYDTYDRGYDDEEPCDHCSCMSEDTPCCCCGEYDFDYWDGDI